MGIIMNDREQRKGCHLGNEDGVTLIEIIIYMAVAGIVLGGAVMAFLGQSKTYNRQDVVAEIQQNIRAATNMMASEIRLALRIGLAQRLDLPRQPFGMLYGELSEVTPADLESASATVLERERTPAFEEKLVGLEYWLNYLKHKYAADFSALAHEVEQKAEALEERYPDSGSDYLRDYAELGAWSEEHRKALAIRLTRQERQALNL